MQADICEWFSGMVNEDSNRKISGWTFNLNKTGTARGNDEIQALNVKLQKGFTLSQKEKWYIPINLFSVKLNNLHFINPIL